MVAFAGSIAETRFRPKPREETAEWGHDYYVAFEFAHRMCGSEAETNAYMQWLYERTVNLLACPDRVAAVEGVVGALLERRTLSGRAARAACRAGIDRWLEADTGRSLPVQLRKRP